ncbi:sarcosine oxidase subunit alpha family protein [Stappia sp. TSB10P1A]|uniref:sarcosine oxidase subunit alpha family protein n=1 Tax=Stappia sp. TSB10P1A TaxID=2003585 RepID=UPI00164371E4|nr:sarcosine oxidase subunit alpha family protein [Stappia sp. TSB10P1A]
MSGYRLPQGGSHLDRSRPLAFRFDGEPMQGFAGDTLASALLASGRVLVGRSFKYHRPRGVMGAGPEEANALVELRDGARQEPNTRATMTELYGGLEAASQNRWPSLSFDMMAVNDLLSPLFSAGFYYKTFMGTGQATWHFCERFIRKAAGLGRATHLADPDRYEKTNAFCDVLVVGAGPAGLMAARAATAAGLRVILADENARAGGRLFEDGVHLDGLAPAEWIDGALREIEAGGGRILPRTSVYGYFDGNVLGAVERVADHKRKPAPFEPRQRHWTIHARHVVLATGAIERPLVFSGNDAPGVMLASAGLAHATRYGVAVGASVVVFANNDGGARTAIQLADLGVSIKAVVDPRREIDPALAAALGARGIRLETGAVVAATRGRKALAGIDIRGFDPISGALGANVMQPGCDALLVSGGWTPSVHLASQAGSAPVFDAALQSFVPGAAREAWTAAGACAGTLDLAGCLAAGLEAGRTAANACGKTAENRDISLPALSGQLAGAELPFPLFDVPATGGAKRFVDFQHDVTADDVDLANREGFRSVEHLKRYTTLGMAADQGKTSNVNAIALMARARGLTAPQVGTTRFRMPWTAVTIGALAGRETGHHFAPVRRTPLHDWHVAKGAEMMTAGLWMRPRAYIGPGETLRDAYIREATAVRQRVGIVDVSTLGKIDVQGPDAGEFLNRLYTGGFAKLPVGKARYGVMLREDGIMFDDGTAWRLAPNRFLVTTTTANAGAVLAHMEHYLEVVWPELRVHVTSVTDRFAGMAVAGPQARKVLQAALGEGDVSTEACPHMGIVRGRIAGAPVMIARLSFSGELAYEVYCDWPAGLAVWETLIEAGKPNGIMPYGMEALGTLRIEKGHITGAEMDGRTTLADVGLGGMASRKKPYVGSTMTQRPAFVDPERPVLVGLVSRDGQAIRAGSHLTLPGGGASLGHVTAVTWSPALGANIALAFLSRGRDRHGEVLEAAFPLKDERVAVTVADPCFYDPDGSRMHV